MFPSILTFDFDLILWSFLTFWGPNAVVARYKVESVPNVVYVQECNDSIECNFHIRKNNLNVLIIVNVESTVIIKL